MFVSISVLIRCRTETDLENFGLDPAEDLRQGLFIRKHDKPPSPLLRNLYKKGKVILVTGHGGPLGCATSRLPHFLDSRLTDGGEIVILMVRAPFTPQEDSGTHFY
jgi:hypothetical protein